MKQEAIVRFIGELLVFGGSLIGGFASLVPAWRQYRQTRKTDHPRWRAALATFGLFAASLQALLLAAFWLYNNVGGDSHSAFQNWARIEIILFVVALLPLLVGTGKYRWWALLSSCLIFVICFFTVLSV
jgi:hypothetical protein